MSGRTLAVAVLAFLILAAAASAQSVTQPVRSAVPTEDDKFYAANRLPTLEGDTGGWLVASADTLDDGQWSTSLSRRAANYRIGLTNVQDIAITFARGFGGRAEVFGSWNISTSINRDVTPLFGAPDASIAGSLPAYPNVAASWVPGQRGDASVGAKVQVFSRRASQRTAVAVRSLVKIPRGKHSPVSSGEFDVAVDLVASRLTTRYELAGSIGFANLGGQASDGRDLQALRWSLGARFGLGSGVASFAELTGLDPSSDGGLSSERTARFLTGASFAITKRVFFAAAIVHDRPTPDAAINTHYNRGPWDHVDWLLRIGYRSISY